MAKSNGANGSARPSRRKSPSVSETEGRKSDGTFAKGYTGNPVGRPLGHKRLAQVVAEKDYTAIVRRLVRSAKGGDVHAAREILSRIDPAPKVHQIGVEEGLSRIEAFLTAVFELIPEDRRPEALEALELAKSADPAARPLH